MIRIAAVGFRFTFLQSAVALLTAALVLAGIAIKGIPEEPTIANATMPPYFKLERLPTGITLPIEPSVPMASGTALAPGSGSGVTLKPYGGGSILP